jgi:sugar-specific transcriptional regulator TrmB
MLTNFFKNLGLGSNDHLVFTTLYKVGINPASTISRACNLERTTTYRILQNLTKLGITSVTKKAGIQYFYVEDEKTLLNLVRRRKEELLKLEDEYDLIESELKNLKPTGVNPPKIKIYDGSPKLVFEDIYNEVKKQNVTTVRLIASETFAEQTGDKKLKDYGSILIKTLKEQSVKLDAIIAEGFLTRERFQKLSTIEHFLDLPASNGSSNIYIVGDTIFILLFKENTIGLKISHPDIAQTFHFMFDNIKIAD